MSYHLLKLDYSFKNIISLFFKLFFFSLYNKCLLQMLDFHPLKTKLLLRG